MTIEKLVIDCLKSNQGITRMGIAKAIDALDMFNVSSALGRLKNKGLAEKRKGDMWYFVDSKIAAVQKKNMSGAPPIDDSFNEPSKGETALKPKRLLSLETLPISASKTTGSSTLDQLDRDIASLETKIRRKTVHVDSYQIKMRTLFKLADILDPSISDVLSDVANDLTQVHEMHSE